jgi:hypothetical protein
MKSLSPLARLGIFISQPFTGRNFLNFRLTRLTKYPESSAASVTQSCANLGQSLR